MENAAWWWFKHRDEVSGSDMFRIFGDRFGLSAHEAITARKLADELHAHWPPQRREWWP